MFEIVKRQKLFFIWVLGNVVVVIHPILAVFWSIWMIYMIAREEDNG